VGDGGGGGRAGGGRVEMAKYLSRQLNFKGILYIMDSSRTEQLTIADGGREKSEWMDGKGTKIERRTRAGEGGIPEQHL
jgi:hypothetical protein